MAKIEQIKFGSIEVDQQRYRHDVLIFPNGEVRRRRGGLGMIGPHGIKKEEVEELIRAGAQAIVIGKGIFSRAKLRPEAQGLLQEAKVDFSVLPSKEAVSKFNELTEKSNFLGGIFHITC
jgi:hypothetical protein